MSIEKERLDDKQWKKWGPYVSDRQWGTVREDYSANGEAWLFTTHEMARSKAYRWGEEGIAGVCDDHQLLCFAPAFWNEKDPILKERFFGLNNYEGNHGEDVKELYYYLDSSPSHSYMKMLYKYPQQAFPYQQLVEENRRRDRTMPEYELIDTGIFENNEYFDIFVEYAKGNPEDILIKLTIHNRGAADAPIHVLPTLWFRNTWAWGYDDTRPLLQAARHGNAVEFHHDRIGNGWLYTETRGELLFCENETNNRHLYGSENTYAYCKDGINNYVTQGDHQAVNPQWRGTKAAVHYREMVKAGGSVTLRFRLCMLSEMTTDPFEDFDLLFGKRIAETEEFYATLQCDINDADARLVQRQAVAGLLWNKQYYYYDVMQWLEGDPAQPVPPPERLKGRNHQWQHLNNSEVISMPDKWEYPWYAIWDLAFHCVTFAVVDSGFAKKQLLSLTKEWYMHPSGKLPAYEWSFNDTNPPVQAWAAWRVYQIDASINKRQDDLVFLETIFQKMLLNFTWWVNRKDAEGSNIFEGGFLGLDNIGVFDRNAPLPSGVTLEQADATSWMAMYALNMMRMALELALHNRVYEEMATKFFEHFLYIAGAVMNTFGEYTTGLWDEEDEFFYDQLHLSNNNVIRLKVRSLVGLIPLFAVEVIDDSLLKKLPVFAQRMQWFLDNRPGLAKLVSRWNVKGSEGKHLLSLLRGHRVKRILSRMLDTTEFLSDYGIRSLSKFHEQNPYVLSSGGTESRIQYNPGESDSNMFGGNSNWRGPIWLPLNFLLIESLQRFHYYYSDDFVVEYPTGSGKYLSLKEIGDELSQRLLRLFMKDENGNRPYLGADNKQQKDPYFKDLLLFYEYFNADTGRGLGAAHQTGWTALVAKLIQPRTK
ncbi:MGH1-like glycoside hydrolase domain-containing protein [Deminuibacter soli]|uniref:Glucosidase n=1 Tax=Deminuibacter soli TaxID=2291815 RepID=A0A3E1NLT1_9BACT|nr:glucosidase [Deminuibacter soli]RFM28873.1 glucosidase [Deminuibacter soli]